MKAFAVVLERPQDAGNIGAVVRAMRNLGFDDLRLVRPAPYQRQDLLRVAHRCDDLIDRIAIFDDLDAALADATCVVGTAALAHAGHTLRQDIRPLAAELVQRAAGGRVALLFGSEADGLDRAALERCHLLAMLPTDPSYPALNLAQSVLLLLYEVRMAVHTAAPPVPAPTPAAQADLERLFAQGEEALAAIGFFRYNPAPAMHTLRQLAYRAELTPEETALLLGIARQIRHAAGPT